MARESTESQQKRAVNNLREQDKSQPVSYTHLTLPTIYSV